MKLRPAFVCLDILLPDGDGVEILKKIMHLIPKTIVLMVTGQRDAKTIKECLSHGARGYILKPFNANTVLKVIKNSVERGTLAGQAV